jgi:hypothetical protein
MDRPDPATSIDLKAADFARGRGSVRCCGANIDQNFGFAMQAYEYLEKTSFMARA